MFLVGSVVGQQPLVINTPANVVQCEPVLITWDGGVGPYNLTLNKNGVPDSPVEAFYGLTGNAYTWTVNVKEGTVLGFSLKDSSSDLAQTAPFTIQESDCEFLSRLHG
ncbi:hypothetical protein CONPUDRAFT_80364 [Coniophora puteana RWD-64-598 SS2]|uniref:Uncharacterized protein n=1 Tax=Coniophora puteana (strain RWD-64-598) TaxID=741705 RepID=A0A5M3MYQ1_CONPW|nr:uncharacterized protein CONPUDRAFT_80364 [Coniophora puteana RWD-64-598 SS2]EIW83775.1 hypothetical protein CONPUDRAFT_80364 [Coniophora puteana RWD-64-598 SS2]